MRNRTNRISYASLLAFLFLSTGCPLPLFAQEVKAEAENGLRSGTVTIHKSIAGYSGTGFVGRFESSGDKLTLSVPLAEDARYDIFIGYCAPFGTKTINVQVNQTQSALELPALDGKFHEAEFGTLNLKAGEATVTITPNWTWFYIDFVRFRKAESEGTGFSLSSRPVDARAGQPALALYGFLENQFMKKSISGVMTLKPLSNSTNEITYLKGITGREPALLGLDFMDHTNSSWVNNPDLVKDAKYWWGRKGIVALCWHWRDPSRATSAFYTKETSFDVTAVFDTTSSGYKAMIRDMDVIAGHLKELQAAGVAVLWRPLHEAAGGWFWWGARGADPCIALWKLMYNRFTEHHMLHNLLWVWTTTDDSKALTWYPGDEFVDIVGMDIYPGERQHGSQMISFEKVKELFGGRKIITLSECGSVPYPENMQSDGACWSYFMPWYGTHTKDPEHNSADDWKKILGSDFVITLDEMPGWTVGASRPELRGHGPFGSAAVFRTLAGLGLTGASSDSPFSVRVFNIAGSLLYQAGGLRGPDHFIPFREAGFLMVQLSDSFHAKVLKLAP